MERIVSYDLQRIRHYWLSLTGVAVMLAMLLTVVVVINIHQRAARAATADWPMFLGNIERSGFNAAETTINSTTAPNLKVHWNYATKGDISSQPVVVNGQVYWGSWDGNEYATDLTGKKIWSAS